MDGPAQCDAVLQRSSAYTAHNEAVNPLTSELMEIIFKALPQSDLAAVRLASQQFAAAVDPLIEEVNIRKTIRGRSAPLYMPTTRLQHVRRANVSLSVSSSWRQVHALVTRLPQLDSLLLARPTERIMLTLSASLVHLTRLDVVHNDGYVREYFPAAASEAQLPGLRVLSAHNALLSSIAAVAPNLQELSCCSLRLTVPAAPLPACTHFGAGCIDLTAVTSAADALAAFSAAFPKVQVVSCVPWLRNAPSELVCASSFLQQLPCLRAARDYFIPVLGPASLQKVRGLTNLQRLNISIEDDLEAIVEQICSLTQLQHLHLDFSYYDVRAHISANLVEGLGSMQHLVTLELPAWMLCKKCVALDWSLPVGTSIDAARVQQGLQALAASSSLQSLAFLRGGSRMHMCAHGNDTPAAAAGLAAAAAAAAAAAGSGTAVATAAAEQQVLRQPVRVQRHILDKSWYTTPHLLSHDSSKSVWGAYGPLDWDQGCHPCH